MTVFILSVLFFVGVVYFLNNAKKNTGIRIYRLSAIAFTAFMIIAGIYVFIGMLPKT
jgi:hypothetical protein